MPNTASAKKRLRQNEKRRLHNRSAKSNMRTHIRRVREAVQAGDSEQAHSAFRVAQKKIDQASSKNLIHKNTAARTKRRLIKLVKSVESVES
jgi:small subunit ribosomal protein S20